MKEKWHLMRDIKEKYTEHDLHKRMFKTTYNLVEQGCKKMRTFIDIDHVVGLKPLYEAIKIKKFWKKNNVELQIGTQLLEGLEKKENIELFNEAAELVDFIGCLPSRDKNPDNHLDIVFNSLEI